MKLSALIIASSITIGFGATAASGQVVKDTVRKTVTTTTVTTTTAPASTTADAYTVINNHNDYSTFSAALKTSGLDIMLKGEGPFTVFAPTNGAFGKLTKSHLDSLIKDQSQFTKMLSNHIVRGRYAKTDIIKALQANKGTTTLKTVDGHTLTLSVNANRNLVLTDELGNSAQVISFDTPASNGVIHGINGVLIR